MGAGRGILEASYTGGDGMKKRIIACVVLALLLCGCTPYSELVPETPQDLMEVMEYVLAGGESHQPLIMGSEGTPVYLATPTGLAGVISSKVQLEVASVTESGETATAVLNITAPDAVALVHQAIEGMQTYDEAVFTENMEKLLGEEYATKVFTVEVELRKVNGTWCMVTNEAFSDAITGGLVSSYTEIQQTIFDAFVKGGEG